MENQETIKLEIEVPKDQIHISGTPVSNPQPQSEAKNKLAEIKKQLEAGQTNSSSDTSGSSSALSSIAKAPLDKLPVTQDKSPPNTHQKIVIAAGLAVALLGLLLWPVTSFFPALGVAIIGAAVVTTGTFVKV